MKKSLPFRASSLDERKEFYEKEFSIEKVKKWFKSHNLKLPQLCAIDAGTESGIIIDKKLKGQLLYFHFRELEKKIRKYIPEDLYYDRNFYKNPDKVLKMLKFNSWKRQELVFDIDVDNLSNRKKLNDKLINRTFLWARKMKKELEKDFHKVEIVYSGAGFHVHVLDDKTFELSVKERKKLNKKFSKYPIDSWVSQGDIYLIRIPYSLNGLVSRIVLPISIKKGLNKGEACPKFLI